MKNKLLQTCLFLTLFGLLLITPIGRVSASTEWNLQVTNITYTTVNYTYHQLLAMPESTVSAAEYCYGYPVTSGNWGGVSLSYLLQQVGVDPAVSSVDFQAQDGYTVSIPLLDAMQPNVIIAYEIDGTPLPETLRLVIPGENGNMWIAMITSITMSTSTVQSGIGGGLGVQASINSTVQSSTQQQEPVQPQSTTPKNENSTEPVASPANVTQPEQKASQQQKPSPQGLGFPAEVVYGIVIAAAVAAVAVGFVVYRRKNTRISR